MFEGKTETLKKIKAAEPRSKLYVGKRHWDQSGAVDL